MRQSLVPLLLAARLGRRWRGRAFEQLRRCCKVVDVALGALGLGFDAATVGECGYPLLLQSGELCDGEEIVDDQHPHDFLMELGALYERELTPKLAMLLYAAPAGEPARKH